MTSLASRVSWAVAAAASVTAGCAAAGLSAGAWSSSGGVLLWPSVAAGLERWLDCRQFPGSTGPAAWNQRRCANSNSTALNREGSGLVVGRLMQSLEVRE